MDPMDRIRAFEEEAAKTSAEQQAKSLSWRKAQAAQLEKDGWTEAAARARAQLEEAKAEANVEAEAESYSDLTKEELYAEVQKRGITGMSGANKDELVATLEADDQGQIPTEED